jgi:predicted TIM-barrel fold metal-dependent hydrolase
MLSPDFAARMAAVDSPAITLEAPLLGTGFTGVDTHGHVFTRTLRMAEGRRYTPVYDAPISAYLAMLDGNGISHGVLVQPSFLGTDNRYLLRALRQAPERLRGVAVLPVGIPAEELAVLDSIGVVGVRLNLIGLPDPTFAHAEIQTHLRRLAELGWLVELQVEAPRLPRIMPALLGAGVQVVVDHFGRPDQTLGVKCTGFRYLLTLGGTRCVWVKLSGAYRNGTAKPGGHVAASAALHLLNTYGSDRLVWGSDWPHTGYEQLGRPNAALRALGHWVPVESDRLAVLVDTPRILFRFGAAACEGTQQTNIQTANLPGERNA